VSFDGYSTCQRANCPVAMCDTGIGFYQTDASHQWFFEPAIDCNLCGIANCCGHLVTCVGGTVPDPPGSAIDLCLKCLYDSEGPACTDQSTAAAAVAFVECMDANCADCADYPMAPLLAPRFPQ